MSHFEGFLQPGKSDSAAVPTSSTGHLSCLCKGHCHLLSFSAEMLDILIHAFFPPFHPSASIAEPRSEEPQSHPHLVIYVTGDLVWVSPVVSSHRGLLNSSAGSFLPPPHPPTMSSQGLTSKLQICLGPLLPVHQLLFSSPDRCFEPFLALEFCSQPL